MLIATFSLLFIGTLERFDIISFANHNLPKAIILNKVEVGIKENKTYNLVASIYPLNSFEGKIQWYFNDKSIAEVTEDGRAYGRSICTALITSSIPYNKMSLSCVVYILNNYLIIKFIHKKIIIEIFIMLVVMKM